MVYVIYSLTATKPVVHVTFPVFINKLQQHLRGCFAHGCLRRPSSSSKPKQLLYTLPPFVHLPSGSHRHVRFAMPAWPSRAQPRRHLGVQALPAGRNTCGCFQNQSWQLEESREGQSFIRKLKVDLRKLYGFLRKLCGFLRKLYGVLRKLLNGN